MITISLITKSCSSTEILFKNGDGGSVSWPTDHTSSRGIGGLTSVDALENYKNKDGGYNKVKYVFRYGLIILFDATGLLSGEVGKWKATVLGKVSTGTFKEFSHIRSTIEHIRSIYDKARNTKLNEVPRFKDWDTDIDRDYMCLTYESITSNLSNTVLVTNLHKMLSGSSSNLTITVEEPYESGLIKLGETMRKGRYQIKSFDEIRQYLAVALKWEKFLLNQ